MSERSRKRKTGTHAHDDEDVESQLARSYMAIVDAAYDLGIEMVGECYRADQAKQPDPFQHPILCLLHALTDRIDEAEAMEKKAKVSLRRMGTQSTPDDDTLTK